jgi:hypothetical protein
MHMVTSARRCGKPLQFVDRLDGDDRATGADGMAKRDRAAIGIGPLRRQAEIAGDGAGLRRKRLVGFDDVELIGKRQARPVEQPANGRYQGRCPISSGSTPACA